MSSDAPIIFKRKSKQARTTRQKTPDVEDTAPAADSPVESPATLASKLKSKIKKSQPKSKLSFGGEEEEGDGEVFKVKKSSLSRKVGLGTHPATLPQNLDQANISSNEGPKYDAAYLSELKASTPNARPRPSTQDSYDVDMTTASADLTILTGEDADAMEASLAIPSESSIRVAKEKRERLRQTRLTGEEDYISLSLVKRDDEPQGPHPESRLMREEDELGEGDDEFAEYTSAQERIALGKKARKREAAQRRDAMKELIEDAEEVDEETVEWEQEQLRRGGHQTPPQASAKVKPVYKAAPIPPVTPIPTLNLAVARLAQDLAQLTTSHAQNSAALGSLAQERAEVDEREVEMRTLVEKAETKRAWFGSFREWVESVAGFLDEKYPLLEELEVEHVALLKERSSMTNKRRRSDDSDDLSIFIGPLPNSQLEDATMDEVDSFGRTVPKPDPATLRRQRRAARIARRNQRRLRQTSRTAAEAEEGYSTDSSLPPEDQASYADALKDLAVKKKEVLADVKAEEFKDPGKGRWAVWREQYSDSYVGAWGGLGVVSVWEFWVRLECVAWDCIEDRKGLDSFKWYQGLYEYSRPGKDTAVEQRPLGPDGDLVASMISTAVVPMICKRLDGGALDVFSLRHIRRMVDLAEEVEASIEEGSPKFQLLLKSVIRLFEMAITETEQLVGQFREANRTSVPSFDPEAIPARRRFLARQVKLLKNLLVWRKYTGERFGSGALATRLVEGCIVSIAETGWDVGGQEVASTVARILPPELLPSQLKQLLHS